MFGNALGWFISAMLVTATAAGLLYIDRANRPTPADAFGVDPANSSLLSLPAPTLVAPRMVEARDGAMEYRRAIEVVVADLDRFESFARSGTLSTLSRIEPELKILEAAGASEAAAIFGGYRDELINFDNVKPPLQALDALGRAALRGAMVEREVDRDRAKRILESVFALGFHLFQERLTYEQLDLGMRLMAESAAGLKQLAKEDANVAAEEQISQFDTARLALAKQKLLPIAARIRTMDSATVAANAGNVVVWARNKGADRVWRIEATMALGRMRYAVGTTGTRGDQNLASRALAALGSDSDPAVATAAKRAAELTVEQYRLLR
jgi:hypothetical protein